MRCRWLILRRIGSTFLTFAQDRPVRHWPHETWFPCKNPSGPSGPCKVPSGVWGQAEGFLFLMRCALLKHVFHYRMTCEAVECHSFCQNLNPSHLFTRNLLRYYCFLWTSVTEVWKLSKICSTKQHPKARRKGGRQRRGGKCQASFAKQIEYYPFV